MFVIVSMFVTMRARVIVRMPVIAGVFVRRFMRFGAMVMMPMFAVVMIVLVPVVMPMRFMTMRMRSVIVAMSRFRVSFCSCYVRPPYIPLYMR